MDVGREVNTQEEAIVEKLKSSILVDVHDAEVIGRTSLSWVSPFWAQNALFWAQNNPESTCACARLVETGIEKRGSQNSVSRQKWIEFPSNIPPFSKATWYF